MKYMYLLPSIEVLFFNLTTLNYCFKRKYSMFVTVIVLCAVTVLFFLPWIFIRDDIFDGKGKFSVLGFIYVIPLKFLYDEKFERLFLNMCMSWMYTLGIMAVSIQTVYFISGPDYYISLMIIETVLFLVTFIPFKKYVIPKYVYIFHHMSEFSPMQFRYLEIAVYFNFFILLILHVIFLDC